MIISIFTPHGGCPERCHFCDQKVSGGEPTSVAKVIETIEAHLATSRDAETEIAFYGGTFTAMPRERQRAYLESTKPYLRDGRVDSIRISTRPDAVDAEWLQVLRDEYRVKTVELGVQSFNARALHAVGRTHTTEHVTSAVHVLRELKFTIGLHLLLGLPDEHAHEDEQTLEWLEKLRPEFVRIHPLLVLEGTALAETWRAGRFKPLEHDVAVERAAWLTEHIEKQGMKVIRLGLQPNELLGEAVLAGAYHPSFGELVRNRIWRGRLAAEMGPKTRPGDTVELEVPEVLVSLVKGHQSANLAWLKDCFQLSSIRVRVVKESAIYDNFKVRICDSPGAPERR